VRDLFTPEELETHIARIEHERMMQEAIAAEIAEEDDPFPESPEAAAERARQFSMALSRKRVGSDRRIG
jgi:hypothetical protein